MMWPFQKFDDAQSSEQPGDANSNMTGSNIQPPPQQHTNDGDGGDNDGSNQAVEEPMSLIARALNALSVDQRSAAYEDLHGVAHEIEETPQLIQSKLLELDQALATIQEKSAFDRAMARSPEYVRSERLKFLRCENFDAPKAAKRMASFFETKLQLWGEERLHRRITLNDFNEDDLATLKSGVMQICSSRDSSGRAIVMGFFRESHSHYKEPKNMFRVVWYETMCAVEEEETQRLGMIYVSYNLGLIENEKHPNPEVGKGNIHLTSCLPFKYLGIHLCYNDSRIRTMASFLMKTIGKLSTARIRMHCGTHMECMYKLMAFGIPVNALPVTDGGERKVTNHSKWIGRRRVKEDALRKFGAFNGIELPGRFDILLGRGKPYQQYPGNIRFHQFIETYRSEYDKEPRGSKKQFAERLLELLLQTTPSCRFLKRDASSGWYFDILESSRDDAVDKVFQALRMPKQSSTKEGSTIGDDSCGSAVSNGLVKKRLKKA